MGYLFEEGRTHKRFLPDQHRGNGRMYDTGYRVCVDSSGSLHLIGRTHFAVEIRGVRVELREIESRHDSYPGIERATSSHVLLEVPSNPELVGRYRLQAGSLEFSVAELRAFCADVLPSKVVPSRFLRIDRFFPRAPNGKIDRSALPGLSVAQPSAMGVRRRVVTRATPRGQVESTLVEVRCSVFAIPILGRNECPFEFSGTSVASHSVAHAISQQLGCEISMVNLFEHPTMTSLAQFVRARQASTNYVRRGDDCVQTRQRTFVSTAAGDIAALGTIGPCAEGRNADEPWNSLSSGLETATVYPSEKLGRLVPSRHWNAPRDMRAGGDFQAPHPFESALSKIICNEMEQTGPQLQRLLETFRDALENAGHVREGVDGSVGVWARMGSNFYYHHCDLTRPDTLVNIGKFAAEAANENNHIASQLSHNLNPCDTSLRLRISRSTFLDVIENTVQALLSHQVDTAQADGVDIRAAQKRGQPSEEGGAISVDGRRRPYDAATTGTTFRQGAGSIVVERREAPAEVGTDGRVAEDIVLHSVRLRREELRGNPIESRDEHATFVKLGPDFLLLTQQVRFVRARLGLEVIFRDLVERYPSPSLPTGAIRSLQPAPLEIERTSKTTPHRRTTGYAHFTDSAGANSRVHSTPRLGRDDRGLLAWFVADPSRSGIVAKVSHHD